MATGTESPYPVIQLLTSAGVVAAGYKLFTYTAGTSTKVNTYTDVALSVANANPIILDSAGACTIFLTTGLSYKYVLAPPTDTDPPSSPVWTRDNIQAIPGSASATDNDVQGVAGEALSAGQTVYCSDGSGGKTAGRFYKGDGTNNYSSTTANIVGFATSAVSLGSTGTFRLGGRITGLSGLTGGTPYYMDSAVPGGLVSSAPANARLIALADTSTTAIVSPWIGTILASATAAGIVSTGTQTLAGAKTFSSAATFSGIALSRGGLSSRVVLAEDLTDHATSGTGATDVWTMSLVGATLLDNETLIIEAIGDQTADANTKTFTFTLGSTLFTPFASTTNTASWKMRIAIHRVSASVQRAVTEGWMPGASSSGEYKAATENLASTLTLKMTITHATSGTTTLRALRAWIELPTV